MSSAPKYIPHYTLDDYRQWKGDWELWSGIPVAMTPSPVGRHQLLAARLVQQLRNLIDAEGCKCEVLYELDWVVSHDTVVRPDIVILCDGIPETHLTTPPALVAEILSPHTKQKDRGAKYQLYEQQGVGYYLLVDPDKETIEAFRLSDANVYETLDAQGQLTITLTEHCRITLDLNKLE